MVKVDIMVIVDQNNVYQNNCSNQNFTENSKNNVYQNNCSTEKLTENSKKIKQPKSFHAIISRKLSRLFLDFVTSGRSADKRLKNKLTKALYGTDRKLSDVIKMHKVSWRVLSNIMKNEKQLDKTLAHVFGIYKSDFYFDDDYRSIRCTIDGLEREFRKAKTKELQRKTLEDLVKFISVTGYRIDANDIMHRLTLSKNKELIEYMLFARNIHFDFYNIFHLQDDDMKDFIIEKINPLEHGRSLRISSDYIIDYFNRQLEKEWVAKSPLVTKKIDLDHFLSLIWNVNFYNLPPELIESLTEAAIEGLESGIHKSKLFAHMYHEALLRGKDSKIISILEKFKGYNFEKIKDIKLNLRIHSSDVRYPKISYLGSDLSSDKGLVKFYMEKMKSIISHKAHGNLKPNELWKIVSKNEWRDFTKEKGESFFQSIDTVNKLSLRLNGK